ncbi:MAG: 5-methyltetrahydropteroyltriglutamate--homocysteine S-methyltransferase [Fibrobacterota bacterium]
MQTYTYGYPRIGARREYKKALESFWNGSVTEAELKAALTAVDQERRNTCSPLDAHPAGEMTLFDTVLDTAFMMGILPFESAEQYYRYCRGDKALPMKKFFNTNYHYIQPLLNKEVPGFSWDKYAWFACDHAERLYTIGPYTFLKLAETAGSPEEYAPSLAQAFAQLFQAYPTTHFHVDEPALVLDMSDRDRSLFRSIYDTLHPYINRLEVFTYYDTPDAVLFEYPFSSAGIDLVHGTLPDHLLKAISPETEITAGVIDGLNVWKTTGTEPAFARCSRLLRQSSNVRLSNAGPLMHLPVSTEAETTPFIRRECSFAHQRIAEISQAGQWIRERKMPAAETPPQEIPFSERAGYEDRLRAQKDLNIPLFPTTTIGSFPQDGELRRIRARYRRKEMPGNEYRAYINRRIAGWIRYQEDCGLDVLVHGEPERTDMVEHFARRMDGIYTSRAGWIISYGSRGYRPPIVDAGIRRAGNRPMTVDETTYAQSLSKRPVKGMLTGPATILAWSYVNPNIPCETHAGEIARALQEEVQDLISAGIRIIQIDEPAFKEGVPLKKDKHGAYFTWAVAAFRAASWAPPQIQIHTHMCYSDFTDIIEHIDALDADVITVETARDGDKTLQAFTEYNYARQIGLGMWDIHSVNPPGEENMARIFNRAVEKLGAEKVWINPDCGLKTRSENEIKFPLQALTAFARKKRREVSE